MTWTVEDDWPPMGILLQSEGDVQVTELVL